MTQAIVVRDRSIELTEEEKSAAHRVLEKCIRGVDESNHRRLCNFWRRLFSMEHGEVAEIGSKIARSGPFHRFHMAMEQSVFEAQDRFTHFKMFRDWLKIGGGHVVWVPGAKGGIVPLPRSISYAELEDAEMREVHKSMVEFLRGPHAAPYLWRNLPESEAHDMMHAVMEGFDK